MIPILVGGLLLLFCLHRRWRLAAFTLFVICIESGGYRATSLIVHRDRPDVHRLETLPVNASYPSGHTAASLALYGGLLLVLASRIESLRAEDPALDARARHSRSSSAGRGWSAACTTSRTRSPAVILGISRSGGHDLRGPSRGRGRGAATT